MEDKDKNPERFENGEDATEYGEFISSYFAWVPLPEQKRKAEEMDKMTKDKNNSKNKT